MAENINLNKQVFNKKAYLKTIDTSFKELGVQTIQEQINEQPTVQEFFDLYNELFYNINELGPTNSHEFLIKTSSEYIGFEDENELINLLQAEIASLREQLLASQKQLTDLTLLIPEAPELPEITIPEAPEITNITTPQTPTTEDPPTNTERVITDFKKYPNSNKNKRASRLNLSKDFIKKVKKDNDL
jgi:hypothetical protein